MSQYIIITGATSGFGKATAELFAKEGYSLILLGRREVLLKELADHLREAFKVDTIALKADVQDHAQVVEALNQVKHLKANIKILLNNAGLALGRDNFHEADINDWEVMINTNLKGLMYVSKIVSQWMVENKEGHIINIGSTAGKEVYPQGNMYCATKHAVDALSKAMRQDLLAYNIKVTAIHPGAADTEFSTVRYKGDKEKADQVYKGYTPLFAADIAGIVWYVTQLPKHVCINDLVVTPTAQANSFLIQKNF